jgi:hypothetical protein
MGLALVRQVVGAAGTRTGLAAAAAAAAGSHI